MDWSTWVQDIGGGLLTRAADAKWVQPYEIQKLQLQALGEGGYYTEGRPGTVQQGGIAISGTTMLLIGGAVLAVLMLED